MSNGNSEGSPHDVFNWSTRKLECWYHSRTLSDGIPRDKNKTSETEVEGVYTHFTDPCLSRSYASSSQCFKRQTGLYNAQPKEHAHQFKAALWPPLLTYSVKHRACSGETDAKDKRVPHNRIKSMPATAFTFCSTASCAAFALDRYYWVLVDSRFGVCVSCIIHLLPYYSCWVKLNIYIP